MTSKQEYDQYAVELHQRFEDFTKWAIANWPKKDFPLLPSDFDASRREISDIIGPKLGDPEGDSGSPARQSPPFVDMNPMPWP